MKLTSKGRYAVMAMADLAKINASKPTNLTDISLRQGISVSFLEQIFSQLKEIYFLNLEVLMQVLIMQIQKMLNLDLD